MSGRLAIGVGCRRGASDLVIAAAVDEVLAGLDGAVSGLFTLADKVDEPGLVATARRLGLPLVGLEREVLVAVADRVLTPSPAARARFGVPAVAEAAALAALSGRARLLGPRLARDGVTVAVAEEEP